MIHFQDSAKGQTLKQRGGDEVAISKENWANKHKNILKVGVV